MAAFSVIDGVIADVESVYTTKGHRSCTIRVATGSGEYVIYADFGSEMANAAAAHIGRQARFVMWDRQQENKNKPSWYGTKNAVASFERADSSRRIVAQGEVNKGLLRDLFNALEDVRLDSGTVRISPKSSLETNLGCDSEDNPFL
jgi:hypothetical protein